MNTYNIRKEGNILRVGFGEPAQNDRIVQDAYRRLEEMIKTGELPGGKLIKINGPASLPVAAVLIHALSHRYETVAIYDPKLGKYVVAITHGNKYLGQLVDED